MTSATSVGYECCLAGMHGIYCEDKVKLCINCHWQIQQQKVTVDPYVHIQYTCISRTRQVNVTQGVSGKAGTLGCYNGGRGVEVLATGNGMGAGCCNSQMNSPLATWTADLYAEQRCKALNSAVAAGPGRVNLAVGGEVEQGQA